jgi:hypothetical protein
MPDYKENTISGSSYQRAKTVILSNIKGQIPSAEFAEEIIYSLGEENIHKNVGSLLVEMTDPNYVFQVKNPLTGEDIPNQYGTYGQIFALLYSAYWDAAIKRDLTNQPQE